MTELIIDAMHQTIFQQLIFAIAGFGVGCTACWLLVRYRLLGPTQASLAKYHRKTYALSQNLKSKIREEHRLRGELQLAKQEIKDLNRTVLDTSTAHAALKSRLEQLPIQNHHLNELRNKNNEILAAITTLEKEKTALETVLCKERETAEEKIAFLKKVKTGMLEAHQAASASALRENNQSFLDLAKNTFDKFMQTAKSDLDRRGKTIEETMLPIKQSLDRYDHYIRELEQQRQKAYGGLRNQLSTLAESHQTLQRETNRLVKALRVPHVRGRWGELTLKRVAELSGMMNRCDFFEQPVTHSADGSLRPDMVVRLPGKRQVVVDAKVPLSAYLDALEAESESEIGNRMDDHVRQIKTHIRKLSQKAYWKQFNPTPEFVVLFIPGENFLSAALSREPALLEKAVAQQVILATPTTLISLLKTVALAWRQETVAQNTKIISQMGSELFDRMCSMAGHFKRLGRDIDRTVGSYNNLLGSIERRVVPTARKFKELGAVPKTDQHLEKAKTIDRVTRKVTYNPDENSIYDA